MFLLLACTPDPTPKSQPQDTETTDIPVDCSTGDIQLTGDILPEHTVQLSIDAPEATLAWQSDAGSITSTGAWTLPPVPDLPLQSTATVTLEKDGCPTETRQITITVDWPEAYRVLILYNPSIEGSQDVADAYADAREIPPENLCPLPSPDKDVLNGADFPAFWEQIATCLSQVGDHIHYLLPTYGVPYKVTDRIADIGSGLPVTTSLDALLFYGDNAETMESADYNPLYQTGDSTTGQYAPYIPYPQYLADHRSHYFLVTRIDGTDANAAIALIDRTQSAENTALTGTVYVDGRFGETPPATDVFGSYEAGEWNMWGTRQVFEDLNQWPVVWDSNDAEFGTLPAPETCPDALFYAGWYSFYHYNDVFSWAPGAIGGHLDSCSACDIRSMDTWAGGALQRGITATFGAVNEPYVAGMPEYDQFFLYLSQGANFAEAAYESTTVGAWMMVWIGDPLYRPLP